MDANKAAPLQVVESVQEGAKKARTKEKDIFDTINPQICSEAPSGKKLHDYDDTDFSSDQMDSGFYADPIVIRDDPRFRQHLNYAKKPTQKDRDLIEYLEKYVGRVFLYYSNAHDLENKITSTLTFQCNYVPFSPMRKYTIPSGVPVAVPRWIICYLKERCQNIQHVFEKKDPVVFQHERAVDMFAQDSTLVIRHGESLIKILDLPRMPKALVG